MFADIIKITHGPSTYAINKIQICSMSLLEITPERLAGFYPIRPTGPADSRLGQWQLNITCTTGKINLLGSKVGMEVIMDQLI